MFLKSAMKAQQEEINTLNYTNRFQQQRIDELERQPDKPDSEKDSGGGKDLGKGIFDYASDKMNDNELFAREYGNSDGGEEHEEEEREEEVDENCHKYFEDPSILEKDYEGSTMSNDPERPMMIVVHVRMMSGETRALSVQPSAHVIAVKFKVQELLGHHFTKQRISFDAKLLKDSGTLLEHGVVDMSTLDLTLVNGEEVEYDDDDRYIIVKCEGVEEDEVFNGSDGMTAGDILEIYVLSRFGQDGALMVNFDLYVDDQLVGLTDTLAIHNGDVFTVVEIPLEEDGVVVHNASMQIFVLPLTGPRIEIRVKPGCTVGDVKARIHEQEGHPSSEQRLIFAETRMEDGLTIDHYNIVAGS